MNKTFGMYNMGDIIQFKKPSKKKNMNSKSIGKFENRSSKHNDPFSGYTSSWYSRFEFYPSKVAKDETDENDENDD